MSDKAISTIKSIIGAVAPTLAGMLGGPLAGVAVGALSKAVLGTEEGTIADIGNAVVQGIKPEVWAEIKRAELNIVLELEKLSTKKHEIDAADRASARARQIAMKDRSTVVLAWLLIGAFIGTSIGVLFGNLKADSVLAGTIIGYVFAMAQQVVGYYFGSSSGSAAKTALIDRIAGK